MQSEPAEVPVCSGVRKFNYPTIKVRSGPACPPRELELLNVAIPFTLFYILTVPRRNNAIYFYKITLAYFVA